MKEKMDPRMHTAEHILNQTMIRMFRSERCFSAHIEKKKSKCDYRFDRALEEEEIRQLEDKVNEVIRSDLPVSESLLGREEAEKKFSLGRLPQESGDLIKIVAVGNYDACPCIGPHAESTSEIGRFRISSVSFEEGVLRIRFKLSAEKGDE